MSSENNSVYERPNYFGAFDALREQDRFCDVTIKVDRHEMRANRFMLAGASNYFHRMFIDDLKESNEDVVTIEGVNEKSMQCIIEFSYTGKIVITKENAMHLLKDADFLELNDVKDKCAEYLESNIDVNNVCEVANLAKLLPGCSSLFKRSSTFIGKNLGDVSRTVAFADLDFEILKTVLSDDTSKISPELTLEIIINWASGDVEKKKNHLVKLFHYVESFKLTAQSLAKCLFKDEVKNSLGSNHSEFVMEALLVFSESKIPTKFHIFVCGSLSETPNIYDFTTENWNKVEAIPCNRKIAWQNGVVVDKGKLYVFSSSNRSIMYVCDFDGMIRNFTEMEIPFDSICSCLTLLDNCLYVCGVNENEVWRFSLKTQTWQTLCPMRNKHTEWLKLAVLQGRLYAVWGDFDAYQNTIEEYDPQADNWTHVCTTNFICRSSTAVGLNDEIYICGGFNQDQEAVDYVIAYNIKEKMWIEVARMNTARHVHAAVAHDGKIWVIGGFNKACEDLLSVEVYDPSTDLWSYDKPMINPMGGPVAYIFSTNS